MNFARLRSFLMVILTLSAARGMAADEATTTNLQEEVRLLRARLDGLEKQLADLNARQAAATPTGTTVAVAVPAATPAPMALLALPSNGGTVGRAASAYMKRLIALLPAVDPHPHLAAEAAYWLATYGFDPRGARKWMDRAGSGAGRGVLLRAEAAVSLAEGQADRATALVNEGLSRIRRPTATGSDDFEVRRLRHLLAGVAAHSTEVKARLAETGFSYFLKP